MQDPEGRRLPIKLDATSNGEFTPVPLSAANCDANRRAHEAASANAKRLGLSRRGFLVSACGAASTLLAFNAANAAAGASGGTFDLPADAALEPQLAQAALGGKGEFVFDVQGHFVDTPKGNAKGPEVFVKDVFLDSDTDMMVLPFVPSARDAEPVTIEAADAVRRVVARLEGTRRLSTRNWAAPGDSSCATPDRLRTPSANCSSAAARTTCSGAPTRSGTARLRIRSRRSAHSRYRTNCARRTAIPRSRLQCGRRYSA
jgi:hypothetical protein